jgi:hypothetical protein
MPNEWMIRDLFTKLGLQWTILLWRWCGIADARKTHSFAVQPLRHIVGLPMAWPCIRRFMSMNGARTNYQ